MDIKHKIETVKERIERAARRAGRNPAGIKLVAVSKTVDAERVRSAFAAGQTIFGENYIQEAREKLEALPDIFASWHFIGHLQSNKAKYAVRMFDLIHTVDSDKLAFALNEAAAKVGKVQDLLVQVNISMETTKSGVKAEDTAALIQKISACPYLSIKGLMTMPPFFDDPDAARPYFKALRLLAGQIRSLKIPGVSMDALSMGMTGDFEAAVEEGATLVRVGTAIFGERA